MPYILSRTRRAAEQTVARMKANREEAERAVMEERWQDAAAHYEWAMRDYEGACALRGHEVNRGIVAHLREQMFRAAFRAERLFREEGAA